MTAVRQGLSKEAGLAFGKGGRPAKDPIRERLRIYRAAGPLIIERGVRRTSIAAIARAACLSPGGIYHYFTSKHQLVLYGLEPEALSRACLDAARELRIALESDACHPSVAVELFVEKNLRMIEFVRPALHAAVELGRPELRRRLGAGIRKDADSFVTALRSLYPVLRMADEPAEAIRSTILGLALDDALTRREEERRLRWLFERIIPGFNRPPVPAVAVS